MKSIVKTTSTLIFILVITGCDMKAPKERNARLDNIRIAELERQMRFAKARLEVAEGRIRQLEKLQQNSIPTNRPKTIKHTKTTSSCNSALCMGCISGNTHIHSSSSCHCDTLITPHKKPLSDHDGSLEQSGFSIQCNSYSVTYPINPPKTQESALPSTEYKTSNQ